MSKKASTGSLEERAIGLLASGIPAGKVAEICDVAPSRISQLMEDAGFKGKLTEAKYEQAVKHNDMDEALDRLEQKVVAKMESSIAMVLDPMKLARVLQVVNGAKRRGTSILGGVTDNLPTVPLTVPTKVYNTFIVNNSNQVIKAGGEDLITIQPHRMEELLNAKGTVKLEDKNLHEERGQNLLDLI